MGAVVASGRRGIVSLAWDMHQAESRKVAKAEKQSPEKAAKPATARSAKVARLANVAAKSSQPALAHPKQAVCTSGAYITAVRKLGFCVRCGYRPPPTIKRALQFAHRDQGKGGGLKTDVRQGWLGCGPHPDKNGEIVNGCHHEVCSSGQLTKVERRIEEDRLGAKTRAEVHKRKLWPKSVPFWEGPKA